MFRGRALRGPAADVSGIYLKAMQTISRSWTPSRKRAVTGASACSKAIIAMAMVLLCTVLPEAANAQADSLARCAKPDSIAVRGNSRITEATIRTDAGLTAGTEISSPDVERAIKALFATGQFQSGYPVVDCDLGSVSGKALLAIVVKERPLLGDIRVSGVKAISERDVRDRVDLLIGRPLDPAQIARARSRIDSLYQASGYYLAIVTPDTTPSGEGRVALTFHIDEGRRLAISGIEITGNKAVKDATIVKSMKIQPEGFFFFHKGEFDDDKFAGDLGERIPALYSRLGFVDMHVAKDTLLVDRARGKGLIEIGVVEGPQYRVGSFEVTGNRRFSTDEIRTFYPFDSDGPTLSARVKNVIKREANAPEGMYNQAKWDDALEKLNVYYHNYGYLYAHITPSIDRVVGPDSVPVVNLRWDIDERNPAIVNRIDIVGNDYTSEECIRRNIVLAPGAPFNQDYLVQSWQSIRNMGFFEQDMAFPDTKQINDQGDIDVSFKVKEKRTGQINFGASMGQGNAGFGGFIGLEQPNLFGLCKKGSLNWQYGRIFNDFTATYSDPTLRGGRVSGSVSAYRSQAKYIVGNLGQTVRTGSELRFGFPVPWSLRSTFALSYTGESVSYLSGTIAGECTKNCFRSNIKAEYTYDTRVELPFPTGGSLRTITTDFSGGPLGGTVNFQRVVAEARGYATIAQLGSSAASSPKLVAGLHSSAGFLFGNAGAFFQFQQFAVGGVSYGQALRGYPEFSITPNGFDETTGQYTSSPTSFGNAFFTTTAEIGLRLSSALYVNVFTDAGNNYASARQFNPLRLYRSLGFGGTTQTPLGALGLDLAYGFDRTKLDGLRAVPDPRWQFHFRLGQIF
jgi:outer membrane protein insertion porin family